MSELRKKQRLVVLGDSLSMPRIECLVSYEDTFAYKISENMTDWEIICRAVRANDTKKQSSKQSIYDDLIVFAPDVVILQLGIVDCAPRLFGKKQAFVLSILPKRVKSALVGFFAKHRLFFTKYLPKVYVNKRDFKQNLNVLFGEISNLNSKVICISIASTSKKNKCRSHGFDENINIYNDALKSKCSEFDYYFFDFYTATSNGDFLLDDGIHIDAAGHAYLAKKILYLLRTQCVASSSINTVVSS